MGAYRFAVKCDRSVSIPKWSVDDLAHYTVCARPWLPVEEASGLDAPARVGISVQWLDLKLIPLAHHICHYLKFSSDVYPSHIHTCVHTYTRWAKAILHARDAGKIAALDIWSR